MSQAVNVWNRDNHAVTLNYRRSTIASFGLLLHSVCIFVSMRSGKCQHLAGRLLYILFSIGATSCLLMVCLKDNAIVCSVSGVLVVVLFDRIYFRLLRRLPKSFTLGEAAVVGQGFTIFAYYAFLQLPKVVLNDKPSPDLNVMHLVLQVSKQA